MHNEDTSGKILDERKDSAWWESCASLDCNKCRCLSGAAGNIMTAKARFPETIDGIAAMIMVLDRCIRHENDESVYDSCGLLLI